MSGTRSQAQNRELFEQGAVPEGPACLLILVLVLLGSSLHGTQTASSLAGFLLACLALFILGILPALTTGTQAPGHSCGTDWATGFES